jgi:hypothetical protein
MKCLRFLLSIVAGAFFLCVATPASLACSQPTTKTIAYSWPPNVWVDVHEGTVPNSPLTTAMNNWNAGLYSTFDCHPSKSGLSNGSLTSRNRIGRIRGRVTHQSTTLGLVFESRRYLETFVGLQSYSVGIFSESIF